METLLTRCPLLFGATGLDLLRWAILILVVLTLVVLALCALEVVYVVFVAEIKYLFGK